VTYGDGQFVAVGSLGTILTSTDGTVWTTRNSGTTIYLISVTYGNGQFVAVGKKGVILTSKADIMAVQPGPNKISGSPFKINVTKTKIVLSLPQSDGPVTFGLFNTSGRRIYSATHQAHNGILNIPISGLSTGMYLMSIRGSNTTLSSAFVVTK
jgi:hypothetical protein